MLGTFACFCWLPKSQAGYFCVFLSAAVFLINVFTQELMYHQGVLNSLDSDQDRHYA